MKALVRAVGLIVTALGATAAAAGGCALDPSPGRAPPGSPGKVVAGGSGGAPAALDLCECTAALGINPMDSASCATCFNNNQLGSSNPCYVEAQACLNDMACNAIRDCLSKCLYAPDCLGACILPMDQDDAHKEYAALLACECASSVCEDKCHFTTALTCSSLSGTGGGGGAGGAGGAGGTGGAGGSAVP